MHLGVVALCSLDSRRDLYAIHIAWLNLRLHQEIQYPIHLFSQDTQITNLWLIDDWLRPFVVLWIVSLNLNSFNREELTRLMVQATILCGRPPFHLSKRNLLYRNMYFLIAAQNPLMDLLCRTVRVFGMYK